MKRHSVSGQVNRYLLSLVVLVGVTAGMLLVFTRNEKGGDQHNLEGDRAFKAVSSAHPNSFNLLISTIQEKLKPRVPNRKDAMVASIVASNLAIVKDYISHHPNASYLMDRINSSRNPENLIHTFRDSLGREKTVRSMNPDNVINSIAATIKGSDSVPNRRAILKTLLSKNKGLLQDGNLNLDSVDQMNDLTAINQAINLAVTSLVTSSQNDSDRSPSSIRSPKAGKSIKSTRSPKSIESPKSVRSLSSNASSKFTRFSKVSRVPSSISKGRATANFVSRCDPNGNDIGRGQGWDFNEMKDASDFLQAEPAGPDPNGIMNSSAFTFGLKPYLPCVKDQGSRTTCTAFATVSTVETLLNQSSSSNNTYNLSEQALFFEGVDIWEPSFAQGGSVLPVGRGYNIYNDLAFETSDYQSYNFRIPYENAWDYNPTESCPPNYNEACSNTDGQGQPIQATDSTASENLGYKTNVQNLLFGAEITAGQSIWDYSNSVNGVQAAQAMLASNVPIVWQGTFDFNNVNSNGFMNNISSATSGIGHAAAIVGFVPNSALASIFSSNNMPPLSNYDYGNPTSTPSLTVDGYFIVKNSWGTASGDGGYYYMPTSYMRWNTSQLVDISAVDLNQIVCPSYATTLTDENGEPSGCQYTPIASAPCNFGTLTNGQCIFNFATDPLPATGLCLQEPGSQQIQCQCTSTQVSVNGVCQCPTTGATYSYNGQCYACPASTPYQVNGSCVSACPASAPYPYNGQCYSSCPAAAPFNSNGQCYAVCPSSAPYGYNGQCIASCPSSAPYAANGQCYSTCPSSAPAGYNGQCLTTCPSSAQFLVNGQCYSSCPPSAPYLIVGQCYSSCPSSAPYLAGSTCWQSCPSTSPYVLGTTCYSACPSTAAYAYNGQCVTACPSAAPYGYNGQCVSTCPSSAPYLVNGQCYASCPSSAPYLVNGECAQSCPKASPYGYSGQCYKTCPSVAPISYNGQCVSTCPSKAPHLVSGQCYASCPSSAPYLVNGECAQSCPKASPYGYSGQCYKTCPSVAPHGYNGQCYKTCPSGAPFGYDGTCYLKCPSTAKYGYDETCNICPSTAKYLYQGRCVSSCPASAPEVKDGVCEPKK